MQLDPHLEQVHSAMRASAALGDERTRQIAETLAGAATPAVRLAILGALGEAADEITAALLDAPGAPAVGVRLDGDEVRVDVTATAQPDEPTADRADGGEANARISLRLSESLKADIEAAAERDGVSVNSWLVRLADAATSRGRGCWPGAADFAAGFGGGWPPVGGRRTAHHNPHHNPHHISGWIDG